MSAAYETHPVKRPGCDPNKLQYCAPAHLPRTIMNGAGDRVKKPWHGGHPTRYRRLATQGDAYL